MADLGPAFTAHPQPPRPTGRTFLIFRPDAEGADVRGNLQRATGDSVVDSREFAGSSLAMEQASAAGATVFLDRFKLAIVARSSQASQQTLMSADGVSGARPEFYLFAIADLQARYDAWVREAIEILAHGAPAGLPTFAAATAPFADTPDATWGLQAVGADRSAFTGRGIRVAVLDTGIDLDHPDFRGRHIVDRNFVVGGAPVQDVQGHGTHTAGTIAGPLRSAFGRRYGVAPDVDLYVGKVLNDSGAGREGDILDGMNWAIDAGCAVISMSLGRGTMPNEQPDPVYERTGAAALREGCLIVAAAGNDSARGYGYVAPLGAPANSPSIMAVAAVDPSLKVAPFSCGRDSGAKAPDIAGPGVAVYSSFPQPQSTKVLAGTSMACPHVAGVAALWAESDPSLRGQRLWDALTRSARPVGPADDVGAGLVQCPAATS